MKAVIQRVKHAAVSINGQQKADIGQGLLVLLGVEDADTKEDVNWLAKKIASLRIFNDDNNVMNRSITEIDGEIIVVSQFTLMASYKKGNRPSYIRAAKHEIAIPLYEYFCQLLGRSIRKSVQTGEFGADMQVELINDGPVTLSMDSKNPE